MKEISFLKKNADKWKEIERYLDNKESKSPDRLAALFTELTDDLGYAKTFYRKSKTVDYLNGLSARVHREVYKNKSEDRSRIFKFWSYELPILFWQYRKSILVSLILTLLFVAVGVLSQIYEPDFVNAILGDNYVSMTIDNIEKGEPMAVYGKSSPFDMFVGIAINNIRVSFIAFIFGAFFSLGTGYILFTNGVMLGTFMYFFHQYNRIEEAFLGVFLHGTLEIWAIVIGGAAGLILGNSILFPGSYPRLTSFLKGARNGFKIVVGMVPIFVIASFIESYITRLTGSMHIVFNLIIIGGSLAFIVWYFAVLPYLLSRKLKE